MISSLQPVFFALLLFTVGNAVAQRVLTPATPFGVEMGTPGSCAALPKALQLIDPNIQRVPVGPGVPDSPDISLYAPMNKAFSGALHRLVSMCSEGRLEMVTWTVTRGLENSILIEVFHGLAEKYGNTHSPENIITTLRKGGEFFFLARDAYVRVGFSKDKEFFSLTYEYTGPPTSFRIEPERKELEEKNNRKGVL